MSEKTCSIDGCTGRVVGRGWCSKHWQRWKRLGDPNANVRKFARPGMTLDERLRLHSDRSGGATSCWPWTGSLRDDAYGCMWFEGRFLGAHVLALIEATGEDCSGSLFALHSCDNPPCINPAHLRWGTPSDNMRDMYARGRHTKRGHKLTDAQVLDIRSRHGETLQHIAAEFGVSFALISQIRNGHIWRHLLPENERQSA